MAAVYQGTWRPEANTWDSVNDWFTRTSIIPSYGVSEFSLAAGSVVRFPGANKMCKRNQIIATAPKGDRASAGKRVRLYAIRKIMDGTAPGYNTQILF